MCVMAGGGVPVNAPGGELAWGVSWQEHGGSVKSSSSARPGSSARNGVGPGICWPRWCGLLGLSLRAEGHTRAREPAQSSGAQTWGEWGRSSGMSCS